MTDEVVDLGFALVSGTLPADHGLPLYDALAEALPWLAEEPRAGVHPVRGTASGDGNIYLSRRARLVLRLPASRVEAAAALAGRTLQVAGASLTLGGASARALLPARFLFARQVVTGARDEGEFAAHALAELAEALDIHAGLVCGRQRELSTGATRESGWALLVCGLGDGPSLRLQAAGLGRHRALGCGVFVPHKAVVSAMEME